MTVANPNGTKARASVESDFDYEPVTALIPYLRTLRLHWRPIVAVAAVALLACAGYLTVRSLTYEAQAQVLVSPLVPGDTNFVGLPIVKTAPGDPTRSVQTVAGVIESPQVASQAAEDLGGGVTTAEVADAVTVKAVEGSNVINVAAITEDPDRSADFANAYASAALEVRQEILRPLVGAEIDETRRQLSTIPDPTGTSADALRSKLRALSSLTDRSDPTLSVTELATPPTSPLEKPAWLLLMVAAGAGILIGAGATILYRSLAERLIEDEDDLLRVFALPIYARVPAQADRGEKGPRRRIDPQSRPAYGLLRAQLEVREINARGRSGPVGSSSIVAVVGVTAEGDSASATLGIARANSQSGAETIIVQGRPTGDPGDRLERSGRRALGEGKPRRPTEDGFIAVNDEPRLRLATAGKAPADGAGLNGLVTKATKLADVVVVDVGPVRGITDDLTVIHRADHIVLAVRYGFSRASDLFLAEQLMNDAVAGDRIGYLIFNSP
jgi:capsular polysaccharide biosynthesis protein